MTKEELEEIWKDPKNWRGMLTYHCDRDPRVIVPKRIKWTGYTINFAHKKAWPVLIGILTGLFAPFLLLLVIPLPYSLVATGITWVLLVVLFTHLD